MKEPYMTHEVQPLDTSPESEQEATATTVTPDQESPAETKPEIPNSLQVISTAEGKQLYRSK